LHPVSLKVTLGSKPDNRERKTDHPISEVRGLGSKVWLLSNYQVRCRK